MPPTGPAAEHRPKWGSPMSFAKANSPKWGSPISFGNANSETGGKKCEIVQGELADRARVSVNENVVPWPTVLLTCRSVL